MYVTEKARKQFSPAKTFQFNVIRVKITHNLNKNIINSTKTALRAHLKSYGFLWVI
jgi:hypothetical protein